MPARASRRGRLITFEGIDGCGKSTQLKLLADHLRRQRIPFTVTREPGGTALGERIRRLLVTRAGRGMQARTELLLMFAARAQVVAEVIQPALARGHIVLCDRYTDSSLAYQGYGRGLNLGFIRRLHDVACSGLWPDATFVLDVDPRRGLRRARRRKSAEARFEREALAFHQRVRRGYRALARRKPRRIFVIAGDGTRPSVHQQILARARRLLPRRRP